MGEVVHMDPDVRRVRRATKAVAAEVCGVSLPTIEAWVRRGAPVISRGGDGKPWVIDCIELLRWRYTVDAPRRRPPLEPEEMEPRDRLAWYQSEVFRKRLEDMLASLVPAEEAREATVALMKTVEAHLATLSDRLREEAGDDVAAAAEPYIATMLADFRQRLEDIAV